jgi:hypothetical protein
MKNNGIYALIINANICRGKTIDAKYTQKGRGYAANIRAIIANQTNMITITKCILITINRWKNISKSDSIITKEATPNAERKKTRRVNF